MFAQKKLVLVLAAGIGLTLSIQSYAGGNEDTAAVASSELRFSPDTFVNQRGFIRTPA